MEPITSLISELKQHSLPYAHLKQLSFVRGDTFSWHRPTCVIRYTADDTHSTAYLLHEYGHALLDHHEYSQDIDLIAMERQAWDIAQSLTPLTKITIDKTIVEDSLDSYRDWLHARSTCPKCQAAGIQVRPQEYSCLACLHNWRVNEARNCALRRYVKP
ncbi:MAG: hypothetical protein WAQ25_01160 [Candidatus Saccharimonas sp.]